MAGFQAEQVKPLLESEGRDSQDSFEYINLQSRTDRRKRIMMKLVSLAHPAHMITICKRFGYALIPQPIRSRVWDDHAPKPKQFATSYLNGLRGLTAIKVFTFHWFMANTNFTHNPWRANPRYDTIVLLPILRYIWTGFTSQMFFGIAGYLTCLRLFQLLDKNDTVSQAKVFASITGSLFRRSFRLYLPVGLMMWLFAMYVHMGFYEPSRDIIADREIFPGPWTEPKPPMYATWYEQFSFWKFEMYDIMNVSHPGTQYPKHDQHLWSILAEMRASLHLYICLLMVAGCKRWVRLFFLCVLTWVFFIWNRWETWVYILGAIVAQLDIILTERQKEKEQLPLIESEKIDEKKAELAGYTLPTLPQLPFNPTTVATTKRHLRSGTEIIVRYAGFILAFYLMSFPIHGFVMPAPGYEYLKSLVPVWVDRKDKVYPNIGTGIILLLLARSDPQRSKWRRILNSSFPQYLGTISFSMYLVHGPLMHAFGYMIPYHIVTYMGTTLHDASNTLWLSAMMVGWSVTLLVAWAAADVWSREIEGRCVRLVKSIEAFCFKPKSA